MEARQAPPPAPAYTAVPMAPLARPLQVAVIDGERWVCMRSLIEGLGIAWLRWANAFLWPEPNMKPTAALDHAGRPTWLLRDRQATNWLIVTGPQLLAQGNASTRRRLRAAHLAWHAALFGAGCDTPTGVRRGRRRTINGQTIRALFAALQSTGKLELAAAQIGLSESTARQLRIYSFPNPTAEMLTAWQDTFGRL